ncbi:fibronectin type III domain-containing protein [Paenibacillus sp. GCM10027626]|uniref:fibronectin type III domain-containing protein n=1 Tax=Paenibacillus sp. GCM10027626 TaxID=3273411 RepID=UPI00362A3A28
MRKYRFVHVPVALFLLLALIFYSGPTAYGETVGAGLPDSSKRTLVFNIDQSFGNGIVVHNDQVALQRMIDAVRPLKARYNVYLLLNPMVKNKENLRAVLDTLAANDMSFILEAVSSDAETLGSCTMDTFNNPADPYHGVTASVDELAGYKSRYGDHFAGLRIFELFGLDWTIRAVKTTDPDWALPCWKIPEDDFFQPDLAEPYLAFADQHNMFVQWSDSHWYTLRTWDAPQVENEQQLSELLSKYPGRVIVSYANNEGGRPANRIDNWASAVQGFVDKGAAGYGLSDQSWECGSSEVTCPVSYILDWALSGLNQGASFVQFEPSWYFFQLPKGSFGSYDYTTSPEWVNRGYPTANFNTLFDALMQEAAWPASSELTAADITESSATLNWTATPNASYYKIYRDGVELAAINRSSTSFQVTGLTPEARYIFKVEAGDAAGAWTANGPSVAVTAAKEKPVFRFEQLHFTDSDGHELAELPKKGFVQASARLTNISPIDRTGTVVLALKDENHRVLQLMFFDQKLAANSGQQIGGGFQLPANVKKLYVELYVSNGVNGTKQLSEVVRFPGK